MIDQVLSHTSDEHPWFKESRVEPRQPQGRLVRLGRRQAGRHAAQQLAVDLRRLGLAVGHAPRSNTTCTISWPSSPTSTSTTARCRTRCSTSPASGWSAASTASGSTRSISTSTARGCEDNPALPPERAQRPDRAGGQSLQLPGPPLRQEPAGEPRLPASASAPCSTNIRPRPRSARSATRSAGWRSSPPTPPAATGCRCATPSTSWRPRRSAPPRCATVLENLRPGRQRRLVVLGLLQPRRDAPRHRAGAAARPTATAYLKVDLGAADVAARLGLPLSGRGARARPRPSLPSRICRTPTASASGRNSRAATAAARRWSGMSARPNGGFSTAKPWLPVPTEHLPLGGQRAAGRRRLAAGALSALPRLPPQPPGARQGRHRVSRGRRRRDRLRAARGQRADRLRLQSRLASRPTIDLGVRADDRSARRTRIFGQCARAARSSSAATAPGSGGWPDA